MKLKIFNTTVAFLTTLAAMVLLLSLNRHEYDWVFWSSVAWLMATITVVAFVQGILHERNRRRMTRIKKMDRELRRYQLSDRGVG